MKLLGVENIGGRVEKTYLDNGKFVVETTQDAEPILDANKLAFNSARTDWKGDMHHVASIPATIIEETCRVKQIPYREFMKAQTDRAQRAWKELLNAREFRYFRTKPGMV